MPVVDFSHYKNREAIEALSRALELAKQGQLSSWALCTQARDGTNETSFGGAYKSRPRDAVADLMRMGWKLTQYLDATTAEPIARPPRSYG